jgi:hypothetical protein
MDPERELDQVADTRTCARLLREELDVKLEVLGGIGADEEIPEGPDHGSVLGLRQEHPQMPALVSRVLEEGRQTEGGQLPLEPPGGATHQVLQPARLGDAATRPDEGALRDVHVEGEEGDGVVEPHGVHSDGHAP